MRRVHGVVCLVAATALFVAVGPSSSPVGGQSSTPPILVVLNNTTGSPLGNFYAEILRTEGVHAFTTTSLGSVTTAAVLSPYRLVVLAETALSPAQAAIFAAYVTGGGRLIAMRPDADLNGTLGITSQAGSSTNRPPNFLSASIVPSGPGAGLTTLSLPFRGPATHFALAGGATVVATMSGGAAGGFPAVHRFGRTATWSFDLAKSVAYVRQGDPLDKNLDRDGQPVYRTNDIFYQRLDLQRVNVPHADVHMRLFVRMVETLLADSMPLPRLWYYPGTSRTLMVVTGDSHTSVLAPHTGLLAAAEGFGARVSLYLSRYSTISASTITGWINRGHEVGLHPYFDPDGLNSNMNGGYTLARNWWQSLYSFPYSPTQRHHSLEWTGWADPALTMQQFGIRMDLSYYAWGPALNNPTQSNQAHGYVNGSGQAMQFIQESGAVTPVYQLVTSLTDEQVITGSYAEHLTIPQALTVSRQLIDESQAGFYAAIATQFHVDYYLYGEVGPWVDGTMDYARSLQIPMWTSEDYLAFIERRRDTAVTNVNWAAVDRTLTFDATLPPQGGSPSSSFTMLVPSTFNGDTVTAVAVDGQAVSAPQFTVNGRSVRAITLTRPANGAARRVAVLYAVPTPALAIGDLAITEGHSGTTIANVPVTLSTPSTNTITVNYSGAAGTASGTDFQVTPGTVTFAPFETSKTIPATIVGDLTLESNETFSITLANASNATIEDGVGIVTISDDDAPPAIAINDATVTEGNTGTVPDTFTVSLAYASGSPVTVQYATANGTATAGSDYTAGSGTLTFAPGVTTQTVTVLVTGETAAEPNETFAVNLSAPVNGVVGDGQGVGTIVNDDSGTVTNTVAFPVLSGADDVTEEGTGFTADAATVWVGAGATPTTSFAGLRFANVTIPPGAVVTSARLELRSSTAQWLTTQFEFGIEASNNSAPFSTTSRPSQRPLLAPRVAHNSDVQWLANTWYQLDELATLVQPAINQAGWASGNALTLVVRGAGQNWARKFVTAFEGGAAFAPRLVVTYSSAQAGTPSLSIGDVTVAEGNSGTANATFQVGLSAPTAQVVTVAWATANGTATAGSDYTAASGTVTFPANSTTPQTVSVPVAGDTTVEATETFVVNLSGPTNATIADGQATGTITNDDTPTLTLGNATVVEGTGGTTTASFTVTLAPASTLTVQVTYGTTNGTAVAGSDYTTTSGQLSFAPGETTKQIQVPVAPDALDESDETFTVALSAPSNAVIAAGGGAGTITDDDGTPSLGVTGGAVNEGNAGTVPLTFTVTLAPASGQTVTVSYATAPGTAASPADFTTASGSLSFAPGETSKTVNVLVVGEALSEANETFTVGLSNAANATIGTASATGTITNDDPLPSLTVNDVTVNEGQAGSTPMVFTVTLSAASGQTVTVTYAATAGSAAEGSDFAPAGGTLTFNPGVTTQQVTVNAVGDTAAEPTETFTLALSNAANATIGDPSGLGTITNDDGIPTISVADVTVAEGAGTASFTVTLSEAGGQAVTVNYATTNASALAGADYTAASGTLTFPVGTVSLPIVVAIAPDALSEASETFAVNLSVPSNATIADGGAVGTITDDDPLPAVSIADAAVAEGNAGTATLGFQVTLNAAAGRTVTVNYASSNGTAVAPGDYAAATGTVTFAAGETAKVVNVAVAGETAVELNETLTVTLSSPVAATLGDDTATGTITNDDSPSLSIAGAAVAEGNTGTTPAVLNVTLSAPVSQIVTVNFAVTPGTATATTDYTPVSGTLTFQPGETAKTVSVDVLGESLFEANETFTVTLSGASGATIGTAAATGTITNDDTAPTLSINDVTVTEGTGGTVPAAFTVTLSAASGVQATVTYTVTGGTATAGTDFTATSPGTLTFAPGVTSQPVTVTVTGDAISEASEGFSVTLSAPANATLADATGAGTITDNDAAPVMSIANATVTEGNAGTVNAAFTVSLSAASGQTVSASVASANGTATAGSDYTALPGGAVVTFAPGVVTQTVNVPVAGDTAIELSETFTVTLTAPVNATLGSASATGTITNDDLPAFAISDVAVNEGNVGTANATFTVSLSQPSASPVTVTYATANVTATAGSDYTAVAPTVLTFPAGTTALPVAVTVIADTVSEPNETFAVNLSAPAGATIADAQGVGTITNDDAGPVTVTVTYQVAAGGDDVNESASVLTAGEATNWLGTAAAAATSYTGLRFTNVTIPAGATITSARLEGNASSTQWLTIGFEYAAEAAVNSAAFTTASRPSQRTLLTPRVTHSSNAQWVANTWYPLEQIAPILQAVIAQPGWTAGNALSLVIRGTGSAWGRKYIRAFEGGAATAPRLVVTYQVSP